MGINTFASNADIVTITEVKKFYVYIASVSNGLLQIMTSYLGINRTKQGLPPDTITRTVRNMAVSLTIL